MGEKQLNNIFELLKDVQNGDILVDKYGSERFKLVFKESNYNKEYIKTFLTLLDKITEDQIKAFMKVSDSKEYELYIHL